MLNNPIFVDAVDEVYSRGLRTLLDADIGSLTATQAHASIKAIRDIKSQLENYVADDKMRKRFGK